MHISEGGAGVQGTTNSWCQWKIINNISNAEYRLNRMVLSHVQGCCYCCKHYLETQNIYFVTVNKARFDTTYTIHYLMIEI